MTGSLSCRRLEWLLRARGTDMTAWPAAERAAALALLRQSQDAQHAYAEALARDDEDLPEDRAEDRAVLVRMQQVLRRRLAPLPVLLRGVGIGVLAGCMGAGLWLAVAQAGDLDPSGDLFNAAQTLSIAALD